MTNYKNFIVVIIVFLFTLPTVSGAIEKHSVHNNGPLTNGTEWDSYHVKAKVSVKDKTSLKKFISNDLKWPDVNSSNTSENSAWKLVDENYIWNPNSDSLFLKVPVRQQNTPVENLEEIQIEYQDLFLNNPTLPSVKLVALKKKSPDSLNKNNPLSRSVFFYKPFGAKDSLSVSSASWQTKDNLYLIRRTLGLNFKTSWRYSEDRHYAVFQRRFQKNLQSIGAIDLIVDGEVNEETLKSITCNFRVSYGNTRSLNVITHHDLQPIILKSHGKGIIRYRIGEFFRQANKKQLVTYLKEMIVFFPGSSAKVNRIRPVKSILFHHRSQELTRILQNPEKKIKVLGNTSIASNSTEISSFIKPTIPIIDLIMQVQTLSANSKRLIIKLPKMINTKDGRTDLENIGLLFKPSDPSSSSGVRLLRMRKIVRDEIKIQSIFAANNKKLRRWGGPFLNLRENDKKFEHIQINSLFPFENFDKSVPFRSNKETRSGISVRTSENALFRMSESKEGLLCDFWFFSKNATATIMLSEVGPFEKNHNITLNWDLKGPLQTDIVGFPVKWVNNSTKVRFLLNKKTSPVLTIKANESSFDNNYRGVRGRLVFKNIQKHESVDLHLSDHVNSNSFKQILCEADLGSKIRFSSKKNGFGCRKFFNHFVESEQDFLKKLEPEKINEKSFVRSRGISIQSNKLFDKWRSIVNGLELEGMGKWIEIDWPVDIRLEKDTQFYLGVTKGAGSIVSIEVIPYIKKHPLTSIPSIPNQSVRLNLPKKNIDLIKLRLNLSEKYPFNLALREMALFEPRAVTEAQAIDVSSEWKGTALIPEQFQSKMPTEISLENGFLNVTMLPEQGRPGVVSWRNTINQKSQSIAWLKTKYRITQSAYIFNPCWLKVTWVGLNQKIKQTICTKSFEGSLLIPVNDSFSDDMLKSIHWEAQLGLLPDHLPLPISFNLKLVQNENNEAASRYNITNFPLLKIQGKKIFPIALTKLTAEEIIANKNRLDLGVHLTNSNSFESGDVSFLDHPYLKTDFFTFKKANSDKNKNFDFLWESPSTFASSSEFFFIKLAYKFFIALLMTILLIQLFKTKNRRKIVWVWVEEIIVVLKKQGQRLLFFVKKITSSIYKQATFLNRLFGLVLVSLIAAMILMNSINKEYIVFTSLILILLGVLWHEFRNDEKKEIPMQVYSLDFAIILWLIWLLMYSNQLPSRLMAPFLALAYFHMPWLSQTFGSLTHYHSRPARFWLTVAGTTYLIGVIFLLGGTSFSNFLKIVSTGHLAFIPYWGHLMGNIQTKINSYWPNLAEIIYDTKENLYVAGFFLFLLWVGLLRIFEMEIISEQFSIIGLYLLATGIILKVKKIFKLEIVSQKNSSGLSI